MEKPVAMESHTCPQGRQGCRQSVKMKLRRQCKQRVAQIVKRFGKDRMIVATCAFGSPSEDFSVLKDMTSKLPRGSFHELGLKSNELKTMFSSLSSSLSSLRTESAGGSQPLTLRNNVEVRHADREDSSGQLIEDSSWHVCTTGVKKFLYDMKSDSLVQTSLGANGIAFRKSPFASGVERLVHRGAEIKYQEGMRGYYSRVGPWIVTKQSKYKELLLDDNFHKNFCRLHTEAQRLAIIFNNDLEDTMSRYHINFVQCTVYKLCIDRLELSVLSEPELEGEYIKYNNNNGGVRSGSTPHASPGALSLGMLVEEEEDEEEESDEDQPELTVDPAEVPQCFSHYSFVKSSYQQLVCDLQGVWNNEDGFVLTDPAIHCISTTKHANGATDKGVEGIIKFFETHKCGKLCHHLSLQSPHACSRLARAEEEKKKKEVDRQETLRKKQLEQLKQLEEEEKLRQREEELRRKQELKDMRRKQLYLQRSMQMDEAIAKQRRMQMEEAIAKQAREEQLRQKQLRLQHRMRMEAEYRRHATEQRSNQNDGGGCIVM